jgi:hypothetical protein
MISMYGLKLNWKIIQKGGQGEGVDDNEIATI